MVSQLISHLVTRKHTCQAFIFVNHNLFLGTQSYAFFESTKRTFISLFFLMEPQHFPQIHIQWIVASQSCVQVTQNNYMLISLSTYNVIQIHIKFIPHLNSRAFIRRINTHKPINEPANSIETHIILSSHESKTKQYQSNVFLIATAQNWYQKFYVHSSFASRVVHLFKRFLYLIWKISSIDFTFKKKLLIWKIQLKKLNSNMFFLALSSIFHSIRVPILRNIYSNGIRAYVSFWFQFEPPIYIY